MTGERFWVEPGVALDLLAADRRVIVPDRRWAGGQTEADFTVHTWEEEAGDLAAVVEASGAAPLDVIAGSNGCSVAVRLALARPDLVRTLVLCWPATPFRRQAAGAFIELAQRVETEGPGVIGTVAGPWEQAANDPRFTKTRDALDAADAATIVRESAVALFSGDLIRGVDAAEAATLADAGRAVWVVPSETEDAWHDAATAAAVVRAIPGCRRGPTVPPSPASKFAGTGRAMLAGFLAGVLSPG